MYLEKILACSPQGKTRFLHFLLFANWASQHVALEVCAKFLLIQTLLNCASNKHGTKLLLRVLVLPQSVGKRTRDCVDFVDVQFVGGVVKKEIHTHNATATQAIVHTFCKHFNFVL